MRDPTPGVARDPRHEYLVLAGMLVALALLSGAYQAIWDWLTQDLRDGGWICALTDAASAAETAKVELSLLGLEGRLVWAASMLLLLSVMVVIVAVSASSLLATITRWRGAVAVVGALILVGAPSQAR